MDSTTRRINESYYKVINNAVYLREYIDEEIKYNDFDCFGEICLLSDNKKENLNTKENNKTNQNR